MLTWNKVEGATGYDVYRAELHTSEWDIDGTYSAFESITTGDDKPTEANGNY
jgi:hypothetical protein